MVTLIIWMIQVSYLNSPHNSSVKLLPLKVSLDKQQLLKLSIKGWL